MIFGVVMLKLAVHSLERGDENDKVDDSSSPEMCARIMTAAKGD
jgi:hypothetical protein